MPNQKIKNNKYSKKIKNNKEDKEKIKNKNDVLEKSDEINFLNQKKEILSYNNNQHILNGKNEIPSGKINGTNKNKIINNEIKINNYIKEEKHSIKSSNGNLNNKSKLNNIILNDKKGEGYEIFDKFKLIYNKNRNKVSSKELIEKLDILSKKDNESGNKRNNLYKIQGEKIIIDNENPKENIFNHLVEEIYTNKSSTKANEIKKIK